MQPMSRSVLLALNHWNDVERTVPAQQPRGDPAGFCDGQKRTLVDQPATLLLPSWTQWPAVASVLR
jgi:hypothetical protein